MITQPRRQPAGAAVLRNDITAAIQSATFEELASVGYGRLSIEAVARRAGVGKAAVYRRWPSKLALVVELVSAVAGTRFPDRDTGSLRDDLESLLRSVIRALQHPLASQIIPDLLAEAARNPEISQTLHQVLKTSQSEIAQVIIGRAVQRGELRAGVDFELAADLIFGAIYWRVAIVRTAPPKAYARQMAEAIAAALESA